MFLERGLEPEQYIKNMVISRPARMIRIALRARISGPYLQEDSRGASEKRPSFWETSG